MEQPSVDFGGLELTVNSRSLETRELGFRV